MRTVCSHFDVNKVLWDERYEARFYRRKNTNWVVDIQLINNFISQYSLGIYYWGQVKEEKE